MERLLLLDTECLPCLLGDLEYPRLRLGDGLTRRDLEYLLGDLPPPPPPPPLSLSLSLSLSFLSPLSPRLLEDDLCRLFDDGTGLLLWFIGDLSRFSAILFFGESFFVLVTAVDGSGGVSFRAIAVRANVSRFGDRIDRGGSGSREITVLSETSFLDVLSTTVFFSYFIDFFGLSTEL